MTVSCDSGYASGFLLYYILENAEIKQSRVTNKAAEYTA